MIIIETTTRERLVLVPEKQIVCTTHTRDATPEDLARGGFVLREQADPGTLAHLRADLRDAVRERDELRHHYDAAAPEHNLVALLDSYESDADTARAQASAAYAMVVAAIGSVGAETIEAAVARLVADRGALVARAAQAERELSEVRELQRSDERDGNVGFSLTCWVESILEQLNIARINRTELGKAAGRYARERDEAKELARVLEVERDTARAELARLTAPVEGEPSGAGLRARVDLEGPRIGVDAALVAIWRLGVAHERARCAAAGVTVATADEAALFEVVEQPEMLPPDNSRILSSGLTEAVEVDLLGIVDTAIGRLDSYGASLVCRGSASGAAHSVALDAYRLGVAHERARQQPAQDRATDEELERAYSAAYARAWESEVSTPDRGERAGVLAVAARVRQERCLIAQAVAANIDVRVCEDNDGRFMVGVHATGCDEVLVREVPTSDVPATLARLLGEVAK